MQVARTASSTRSISAGGLGRVLLGTLIIAAEISAATSESARENERQSTKRREDSEWSERKLEALSSIERGVQANIAKLDRKPSYSVSRYDYEKIERKADELRLDVARHARNKDDWQMSRTERAIVDFITYGY